MFGDVERRVLRESAENAETEQESLSEEFETRLELDLTEAAQEAASTEPAMKWIAVGREHAEEILERIRDLPDEVNMKMFEIAEKVSGDEGPRDEVWFYLGMNQKTPAITLLLMDALRERRKRKVRGEDEEGENV